MASLNIAMDGNAGACWQCGAPAREDCAYPLKLVARPGSHFDALGYPVTSGRGMDTVIVRVPRCAACRGRGQDGIVLLFVGMIVGAILGPIFKWMFAAYIPSFSWVHVLSHRNAASSASAIGVAIGAVVAIVGVAWRRRSLGFRSLNSYPPVIALKQAGWHFPVH